MIVVLIWFLFVAEVSITWKICAFLAYAISIAIKMLDKKI